MSNWRESKNAFATKAPMLENKDDTDLSVNQSITMVQMKDEKGVDRFHWLD
jgi:hypothetical protein